MGKDRSLYERIGGAVAPVVEPGARFFARRAWTPEQSAGLLCPGRRAGGHHAPAAGCGGARRRQRGHDAQHRTPPVPLSGQPADPRGPALDPPHRPLPRLLARSTPGLRARRDRAGRARDRAVSWVVGALAALAGELAGVAGARAVGAAAMGGGRYAAGPRHPPSGSRRLHAVGRSRTGRASAGPAVRAARLALPPPRVRRAHLPAPARALGAHVASVPSPGPAAWAAVVRRRPALAGAPAACPGQRDLGARAQRALDRRLRPTRGTAARARVCAQNAGRIDLPRSQASRLGPGRNGHRRLRASGSAAAGAVSRPLVAGAPGGLVCPSWAARSVRPPRSPGQGHLSAGTALVARYPAPHGHRNEPHTVLAFPKNPHRMGVLPPLLKSVRERGSDPRRLRCPRTTRAEHGARSAPGPRSPVRAAAPLDTQASR